MRECRERLAGASMDARERQARLELIRFQLGEIDAVRPAAGEDAELDAARRVLANAERVEGLCRSAHDELYDSDHAALTQLASVWKKVEELATLDPVFGPHLESRTAVKAQLEDLASYLRAYADGVDASPARLQEVEDRLARLERLKRKYGPGLDEVLAKGASLRAEASRLDGSDLQAGELTGAPPGTIPAATAAAVYLRSVLQSTPRLVASSFCDRPAYQWVKISITSIMSKVLLANVAAPLPRCWASRAELLVIDGPDPGPTRTSSPWGIT